MRYLNLILTSIKNSFRLDTAFLFNNWANLISTSVYVVTWLLFFEIIFQNTDSIAGYTRDEMLFLVFTSQVVFYAMSGVAYQNLRLLIKDVNSGQFDFVLLKPVPSMFYTLVRRLNIFSTARDAIAPMLLILLAINFTSISITPANLVIGIAIQLIGLLASYLFLLITCLPVFWIGEASSILDLFGLILFDLSSDIPYSGYQIIPAVQFVLTAIIPFLIATALPAAVILGKVNSTHALAISITVLCFILFLSIFLWRMALRNYSSAS